MLAAVVEAVDRLSVDVMTVEKFRKKELPRFWLVSFFLLAEVCNSHCGSAACAYAVDGSVGYHCGAALEYGHKFFGWDFVANATVPVIVLLVWSSIAYIET